MSQAPKDAAEHYLVIVRNRHGGGDDGHHGGAWKIAYADFMTAMMAFFLVMWLINATDEKTIIQVATYFNPLRLSDKVPSQKGLHEGTNEARGGAGNGGPSATGTTKPSAEPSKKDVASPSESKKKAGKKKTDGEADQQLFADPFASLDKIAAKVALAETPGDGKDKAANDPPPPTGEVVRDPYDPIVRPKGSEPARTTRAKVDETAPTRAKEPGPPPAAASGAPGPTPTVAPTVAPTGAPTLPAPAAAAHKETPQETAAKLEAAIRQAVAGLSGAHPILNVTMTSEGVLIDLTDNTSFSMFAVGSAEPRAELVVVMARIGGILAKQSGPVVIRGHTDGRPYRTAAYDNWRLSSARAHMASYMLIRGGLSDGRIERIEGHADRALKVPIDKEAAQNRRIEILLKVPPS